MKLRRKKTERILSLVLVSLFGCIVIGGISIGLADPYADPYTDPYIDPYTVEYTEGNWKYTVSDGEATITQYLGSEEDVMIPSVVNTDIPVTGIGTSAFDYNSTIKTLSIPDSITNIESISPLSRCLELTDFYVAAENPAYSAIDGVLFNKAQDTLIKCPAGSMGMYIVPSGVTRIGENAFTFGLLSSIFLPEGVTRIDDQAFNDCDLLIYLELPETLEILGDKLFDGCSSMEFLYVPPSVTSIGDNTFSDLHSDFAIFGIAGSYIETYCLEKGIDFLVIAEYAEGYWQYNVIDGEAIITGYTGSEEHVVVPSVLNTGIPVTGVDYVTFFINDTMKSITIPTSVVDIFSAGYGFEGCFALTHFNVAAENPAFSSVDGVLFDKAQNKLLRYPNGKTDNSYVIPTGVTTIGDNAFTYSWLTSITIPEGVTEIEYQAFAECTSLVNIEFPETLEKLGCYMFAFCESLSEIYIPPSVTMFDDSVFSETNDDLVIRGIAGSDIQAYCTENGLNFEAITDTVAYNEGTHGGIAGSVGGEITETVNRGANPSQVPDTAADSGYVFSHWTSGGKSYTKAQVQAYIVGGDVTFTAVYTAESTATPTPTATPASTTEPTEAPDDEPKAEISVGEDAVSVEVDGDTVTVKFDSDALDNALDDAIQQINADDGVDGAVVTLPCDGGSFGEATELSVEIDASLAQKAAENNVSLKVVSNNVDMTIPPSVLDTSGLESVDEDSVISIGIKSVDEQTVDAPVFKLQNEQGEPLGVAFEFEIVVSNADGSTVEIDEFDSPVTITIQLTEADIEGVDNLDGLKMAWYNTETDEIEVMTSTFNSQTLELTFSTTHFSMYMLVEMTEIKEEQSADSEQAMDDADSVVIEEEQVSAAVAANESNSAQSGSSEWWIWLLVGGLVIAAAVIVVVQVKRKRA